MDDLCQAQKMAERLYDDDLDPCYEPAAVEVKGYRLCRGCAESHALLRRVAWLVQQPSGGPTRN